MQGIRIAEKLPMPISHFFEAVGVEDIPEDELRELLDTLKKPEDLPKLWQIYQGIEAKGHKEGSLMLQAVVWAINGAVKEALKLPKVVKDVDTDFLHKLWHQSVDGTSAQKEVEKILLPMLESYITNSDEMGSPSFFQLHQVYRTKGLHPGFREKLTKMMVA